MAGNPRVKRAFDLVITSSGMRRKVIECRPRMQRCLACGRTFVPKQHERLDKHFHGLKSWVMYQHVAHRLSMGTIETMLREFFDLTVSTANIHMFKSLMADYYQPTYKRLLENILAVRVAPHRRDRGDVAVRKSLRLGIHQS